MGNTAVGIVDWKTGLDGMSEGTTVGKHCGWECGLEIFSEGVLEGTTVGKYYGWVCGLEDRSGQCVGRWDVDWRIGFQDTLDRTHLGLEDMMVWVVIHPRGMAKTKPQGDGRDYASWVGRHDGWGGCLLYTSTLPTILLV